MVVAKVIDTVSVGAAKRLVKACGAHVAAVLLLLQFACEASNANTVPVWSTFEKRFEIQSPVNPAKDPEDGCAPGLIPQHEGLNGTQFPPLLMQQDRVYEGFATHAV